MGKPTLRHLIVCSFPQPAAAAAKSRVCSLQLSSNDGYQLSGLDISPRASTPQEKIAFLCSSFLQPAFHPSVGSDVPYCHAGPMSRPLQYRVRKYSASVMVADFERGVRSVSPPANLSRAKHNNISRLHATNLKWLVDKHGPTSDALRGLRALSYCI
jgi:hypothetical protein